MNPVKVKRKTLRSRRNAVLFTVVFASIGNGVIAGTHSNPFLSSFGFESATTTETRTSNQFFGSGDLQPIEVPEIGQINFEAIDELVVSEPILGKPRGELQTEHSTDDLIEPPAQTKRPAQTESATLAVESPRRLPQIRLESLAVAVSANAMADAAPEPNAASTREHSAPGGFVMPDRDSPDVVATATEALSPPMVNQSDRRPSITTRSISAQSCNQRALEFLDEAHRESSVSAWASAEASVWNALELVATEIDLEDRQKSTSIAKVDATRKLRAAKLAINEGRDFFVLGTAVGSDQIQEVVSSHETTVLKVASSDSITAIEAVDRYYDFARKNLIPVAAARPLAAHAMDLLAAIQLGRDEASRLPDATSLCLRRAALQGQPSDGSLAGRLGIQLADMGLDQEAQWTLSHAVSIAPTKDVVRSLAGVIDRRGDQQAAQRLTATLERWKSIQSASARTPLHR